MARLNNLCVLERAEKLLFADQEGAAGSGGTELAASEPGAWGEEPGSGNRAECLRSNLLTG